MAAILIFALGGMGLLIATGLRTEPLPGGVAPRNPGSIARDAVAPTPTHLAGAAASTPPAAPLAPVAAADSRASTTLVVVRWKKDGVELVDAVHKPALPWVPGSGEARFVIVDAETGARLGEGPCGLPRLCDCERGADHTRGDVMVRHEAVVRLKLPRLAARERVVIEAPGPSGWEPVGTLLVEDRS